MITSLTGNPCTLKIIFKRNFVVVILWPTTRCLVLQNTLLGCTPDTNINFHTAIHTVKCYCYNKSVHFL